jgi:pilus retraction protein PilT
MDKFENLISSALGMGVSDLHLTGGHPVVYRLNGLIKFQNNLKWNHEEVDTLVQTLLNPGQLNQLRERYSLDCALSFQGARLRINCFVTTRGLSLAIRILPGVIPSIETLNLHPSLKEIAKLKSGLVLICGATGVGKTTTIAAIIDEINRHHAQHIITLEDPIEYRIASRRSFVEQRELGTHMPTFEQGLLDVLREDPDVIVVGEIRDPESIKLTLNIAESGHLIIATLHASNSEEALHRICNAFPLEVQQDIRFRLASTLNWLVVQQLVLLDHLGFRVPRLSILVGSQALKGTIRENKLHQIENLIQLGKNEGMFSFDRYLKEYLMIQKNLTPPVKVFQPSLEDPDEIVYISPVLKEPSRPFTSLSEGRPGPSFSSPATPLKGHVERYAAPEKSLKEFIEELDKKFK